MDDWISSNEELIRAGHGRFDKTRCAGWLAATGNRPVKLENVDSRLKSPVLVFKARPLNPNISCDVHLVEEGDL